MKRIAIIAAIAAAMSLAACHTVNGVGKDVSAVGHGVSDAATH